MSLSVYQTPGLITGEDGKARCWWCGEDAQYTQYHDTEWGYPVTDDTRLFEKICLEGFQSGLSWLTILRKRENFRAAFEHFDIETVARYRPADVERLMNNAGIVRHRGKIAATINNAQRAADLIDTMGSLAAYVWRFEPAPDQRPAAVSFESVSKLAKTPASAALARDLKARGWKFFGPTTAYAFMQAMGLVNDHLEGCHVRGSALAMRGQMEPPH